MNARAHRIIFDRSRGLWLAVAEHVRGHGKGARRARAAATLAAAALLAVPAGAQTLPGGGAVVQGAGSIQTTGSSMVVRQDTARMVADWQSFSIGAGASVNFVQPSASAVALNRVIGGDPTAIFGSLTSNGHVYLQNPNGVLFAPGARVDVGSLVATTLNVDLAQFAQGRLRLSGTGSGAVVNQGLIRAAEGGSVVLAGPQVANDGDILAPGGTIALAAGQAVNVDATGSGLLSIEVPVAAIGARLDHSGRSQADGGLVSLQAAAADAARRTVMQVDGVVRARRIEQRGGQIVLAGGPRGDVRVGAELDASSADGAGGQLQVLGEHVSLTAQARLDARGAIGGGEVLVGGNLQGQGPQPNARSTTVEGGAQIDASANAQGDGGRVIVWADGLTAYAGSIRATGGMAGGDGGFVEVSGKRTLDFQGQVDLRAPQGQVGSLLLDPDFIIIGDVADVNGDGNDPSQDGSFGDDLPGPVLFADAFPGATSLITAARVAELLATSDILLQAVHGIQAIAPVTMPPDGPVTTLRLEAPSVAILSPMDLGNSSLAISTPAGLPDNVVLDASVRSLRTVSIDAASVSLLTGTIDASLVRIDSNQDGSGVLYQSELHAIHSNTLVTGSPGASFDLVHLLGQDNQLRTVFFDAYEVILSNANSGFRFEIGGSADTLDIRAMSGVMQTTPLVVGDMTVVTTDPDPATGAVLLRHPGNEIPVLGFSVASHIDVSTHGDLAVGPFFDNATETLFDTVAGGAVTLETDGRFILVGDIHSTGADGTPSIDIRAQGGFQNSGGGLLIAPGGRFLVKSDDYTVDDFGPIGFGRNPTDFGFVVYDGHVGAVPDVGNGLITNQAGRLSIDPADLGPISKLYDGTTAFTVSLDAASPGAATAAVALVAGGSVSLLPVTGYQVDLSGDFDDRHAGNDKGFTLVPSLGTVAQGGDGAGVSVSYYGLEVAPFVRPAGAAPGFPEASITPRPVTLTGLVAQDKVYDATIEATLSGVPEVNVLAGDDVTVSGVGTGSFLDKQVGADKPVIASGLTLGGADAANYTLGAPAGLTASISQRDVAPSGIRAVDRVDDGQTRVELDTSQASLAGVLPGDLVSLDTAAAFGQIASPEPGVGKPVTLVGLAIGGLDSANYRFDPTPSGAPVTVTVVPALRAVFEELRFKEYLQGVSDAQEPFRRAMAEALAAGFGKENIRKRLAIGLVFETGLAAPAIDDIQPAKGPARCTLGGSGNGLALSCP